VRTTDLFYSARFGTDGHGVGLQGVNHDNIVTLSSIDYQHDAI
jgi:hypothetical protein